MRKPFFLIALATFCQIGSAVAQIEITEDDNVAIMQQSEPQSQESEPTITETVPPPTKTRAKNFTERQTQYLKMAYIVGEKLGHGATMQAIMLQESRAGEAAAIGNPTAPQRRQSYGIMQIQIVAARSVLKRFPEVCQQIYNGRKCNNVSTGEIVKTLIHNKEASILIATYNFHLMMKLTKGSWHRAVAAYNAGIGNALQMKAPSKYGYVESIARKVQTVVKPFNQGIGLIQ